MKRNLSRILDSNASVSLAYWFFALIVFVANIGTAFAINVTPSSVSTVVGSSVIVNVTETRGTVTATSSAPTIATVDYASGIATIHGVSAGTATITVANGENRKRVSVTVRSVLSITPSSVSIPAGASANVSVSNISGTVTVKSSSAAIATASYASGTITISGVAAGSATVTVADNFTSRTVAVTVTPPLTVTPATLSLAAGATAAITVIRSTGSVTAASSNKAVATVTYAAGTATVRAVAPGSATVTISDSFSSRTVAVTVTGALAVSPTSVSVQAGSNAGVSVTNAAGAVRVSTSNSGIATVTYASGTATIHGVAAGSATITVADTVTSRQVTVTVTAAATLTVSPTSVVVGVGKNATVAITNASGIVTVNSSNTSIAIVSVVNATATINGVATGNAVVTISDGRSSRTVSVTVVATTAGNYTLLAWNNLGMHCFDGVDYSIFTILPPLNTLLAQLQNKAGALVTSGVTLTYEATTDTRGSINGISSTKTNFWQYVLKLFGAAVPPDMGLLGFPMASRTPTALRFNAARNWYEAPGIPITNHDDTGAKNEYPMIKVVAKDAAGQTLATTNVVLPVSDELACGTCHNSNTGSNAAANAARPATGWVFDADPLKDWKLNILRLHDEKQTGKPLYAEALQAKGYPNGLFNSASSGNPVLCVGCHVSNAYQVDAGVATGYKGVSALTSALHTLHGNKVDPATGLALDNTLNRNTCYLCHPGSTTQCLRGAMSGPATQCQSCHGNMSKVGETTRAGWLSEPGCQNCHNNGQRSASAVDGNGNLLPASDQRFATTPDQPSAGFSLYRFSTGHGGVKCEACHGATHAEYPSLEANDNVQSIAAQGHAGTVNECTTCHLTVPLTANGGPHGMHTTGNQWVSNHHDLIGSAGGTASCAYCHGANFRGSPLSAVKTAKTFNADGRTVNYVAGQQVSCYDCHNGPNISALGKDTKLASTVKNHAGFDMLALNLSERFSKLDMLVERYVHAARP